MSDQCNICDGDLNKPTGAHGVRFCHEEFVPDPDEHSAQEQYDQQQADAIESNQDWLQDFYDRHS